MELVNLSPFLAQYQVFLDARGQERMLVVAKATYTLERRGKHFSIGAMADEQEPVELGDRYRGDPSNSSLLAGSDLVEHKPAAEVLLLGHGYTRNRAQTHGAVSLRLGSIHKEAVIVGDRTWDRTVSGPLATDPQPTEAVPLSFERAFGGSDQTRDGEEVLRENPVGCGLVSRHTTRPIEGRKLPNLEHPNRFIRDPTDRPPPMGFGPLAPHWADRAVHAGTYDEQWLEDRMPMLPIDFDPRFHQTAPRDQILSGYLLGGEHLSVEGVRPDGAIETTIPGPRPEVVARVGGERRAQPMDCDTLILDADRLLLVLTFRTSLVVHGRMDQIPWVKIQLTATSAVGDRL